MGSLFKSNEVLAGGQRLQSAGIGALEEGINEFLAIESEAFGEDEASMKAGAPAGAAGFVKCGRSWNCGTRTAAAQESLAENQPEGAADEVGFELHFEEAGESFDSGARMEGAEHEVAGEGGLENGFGCSGVADFTDEDHVGILAHQGSDAGGQIKASSFPHLRLSDSWECDFDGVFQSHYTAACTGLLQNLAEAGVGCGGLAASGWPGEQDHSGGFGELCEKGLLQFVGQSQFVGQTQLVVVSKQANGSFFAVQRWESGNADFLVAVFACDATFLRDFSAVCEQSGEDFEASDEAIAQFAIETGDAVQHAIDAELHSQSCFFRHQMHVTGALSPGFLKNQRCQCGDVGIFARRKPCKCFGESGGKMPRILHELGPLLWPC